MRELKLIPDQLTTVNLSRFLFAIKKQKPDNLTVTTKIAGNCLSDLQSYAQVVIKCRLHYSLHSTLKSLFVVPSSITHDGKTDHVYDRTGKLLVSRTKITGDEADFVFAFDCSDYYPTKSLPADPAISADLVANQIKGYLFGGDSVRAIKLFNYGMQCDLTLKDVRIGSHVNYTTDPQATTVRKRVKVVAINQFQRQNYVKGNVSVSDIKPFIVVQYQMGRHLESRVIYPSQIVGILDENKTI